MMLQHKRSVDLKVKYLILRCKTYLTCNGLLYCGMFLKRGKGRLGHISHKDTMVPGNFLRENDAEIRRLFVTFL